MADTTRLEEDLKKDSTRKLKDTKDPLEILRLKLLSKGASGIKGMARAFRNMDDDGSKSLSYEEFRKGLGDYGVSLEEKGSKELFDRFDQDKNGTLSFDEFLTKLRPPMSDTRVNIISKAFDKLDAVKDGVITVADLKKVYNAKEHPKVRNGSWTEEQVFLNYLKNFDSPNDPDGKVTWEEFLNYYSGVSASVDTDAYFDLMMRNAWKI